jgi:hypothetical protein
MEKRVGNCPDCGKPITRRAVRCGSCNKRKLFREEPERLDAMLAWHKTDESRQRKSELTKAFFANPDNADRIADMLSRYKPLEPKYGADNTNWKGGITPESDRLRASDKYKQWRTAVFTRDNFICQLCGIHRELQAHHIKSWSEHPELRFDVSNGIALCLECHSIIHDRPLRKRRIKPNYEPCPQCGKPKTYKAAYCRPCASVKRRKERPDRIRAPHAPRRYLCPVCGGEMGRHAKRTCIACRIRAITKPKSTCLGCGKELSDRRSVRCRVCANQLHNQNLTALLPHSKRGKPR